MRPLIKGFIFSIIVFVASQAYAQQYDTWYQAGPKFKLVSSRMTIDSDRVKTSESESEIGYQFGGWFRVNIDKIYVQPEVLYSTIKTQLVFQDYQDVPGFNPRADFEFNTLEIPVDIGFRAGNFRMNTGPSLSLLLSGQRSFLNEVEKVTDKYNKVNMLWHFGVGADAKRITLDLKYEFGLSKTGESLSQIIGTDQIPKQRQWIFAVGFNLMNDY